jgi:hypothetical protein
MKTEPLRFRDLLQKDIRLVVPLFQRPYVWNKEDQWEPLWEDIRGIAEDLLNNRFRRPHFLGAIVLEQVPTGAGEVEQRLVIDGQQRLTTAQIILEAFHDVCGTLGADKPRAALAKMTRIEDPMLQADVPQFKVWPTTVDQEAFRLIMEAGSKGEVITAIKKQKQLRNKPVVAGYLFFSEVMAEWLSADENPEPRITALLSALRDHLRFVVIDLQDDDDAQLIFETLNARGTPLLPTDLVKNFVFHRARLERIPLQKLYDKYWGMFDEWDEWWRELVGRGHAQRARIDLFLQAFLTMQLKEEVPVTHVYATCRDFIIKQELGAEAFLKSLRGAAELYRSFFDFSSNTPERRFFDVVQALELTSVMPVALDLFSRCQENTEVLHQALKDIQSFLIRRMVCGLNTRGYNRLFVDLLGQIGEDAAEAAGNIRSFLLKSEADSARWPNDEEFLDAWLTIPAYKSLKKQRTRWLLETLEVSLHNAKTEQILTRKLQIEHLMPQSWQRHWSLPGMDDQDIETAKRNTVLHTIGNLTLVTNKLNPSVSNGAWLQKRKQLSKFGALALTRDILEAELWDETQIQRRSRVLFRTATRVWSYPKQSWPARLPQVLHPPDNQPRILGPQSSTERGLR